MKKNQMTMAAIAFGREPANYSPLWILLNGLTVVRLLPIQSLGNQPFAADNPAALDNPYIINTDITRCATKNDRIRVPEDTLSLLISESLVNQD